MADEGELRQRIDRLRAMVADRDRKIARMDNQLRETTDWVRDPEPVVALPDDVEETIRRVREERLTYLPEAELRALARLAAALPVGGRGCVIEAGAALGGSSIVLGSALRGSRPLYVHDVFGLIPPPSERDGTDVQARYASIAAGESKGLGGDTYYGYREDLLGEVRDAFARLGVPVEENDVHLVQGLFEDTVTGDEPVALAHLDGDWYDSTMVCLERIVPRLVPGGRVVVDDYWFWSGAREAVRDFLARTPGLRAEYRARVHLVREG